MPPTTPRHRRLAAAAALALLAAGALYVRHRQPPSLHVAWPPTQASLAAPAGPPSLRVLSRTFGRPRAVAADGHWLYVAIRGRVEVFDVEDPAEPRLAGKVAIAGDRIESLTIDAAAGRLYAPLGDDGVAVVDIGDPRRPVALATIDTPQWTARVAPAGDVLWVAAGRNGVAAYDVAPYGATSDVAPHAAPSDGASTGARGAAGDRSATGTLGTWTPADGIDVVDILVRDGHVFALSRHDGVIVLDGSDPTHPAELARAGVEDDEPSRMALDGHMLWVAAAEGWWAVDVREPARPEVAGAGEGWERGGLWPAERIARTAGNWVFTVDGHHAFRVDGYADSAAVQALDVDVEPPREVWRGPANPAGEDAKLIVVDEDTLIVGTDVVDTSDPQRPRRIGPSGLPHVMTAVLDGQTIAAIDGHTGFSLYRTASWPIGPWHLAGSTRCRVAAENLVMRNGRAVVANAPDIARGAGWPRVAVIDTRQPARPRVRSGYDLPAGCGGSATRATAQALADRLYASDLPLTHRLAQFIEPPELPAFDHVALAPGERYLVGVGWDALAGTHHEAMSGSRSGLAVLDLAALPDALVVGALPLSEPGDVLLDGSLAILTGPSVRIVDLLNPRAPRLRGSIIWPAGPGDDPVWHEWQNAAIVHGCHLLVATAHRIAAMDVADPDAPAVVAERRLGADVIQLAVQGDALWALSRDGDLIAIDLTR